MSTALRWCRFRLTEFNNALMQLKRYVDVSTKFGEICNRVIIRGNLLFGLIENELNNKIRIDHELQEFKFYGKMKKVLEYENQTPELQEGLSSVMYKNLFHSAMDLTKRYKHIYYKSNEIEILCKQIQEQLTQMIEVCQQYITPPEQEDHPAQAQEQDPVQQATTRMQIVIASEYHKIHINQLFENLETELKELSTTRPRKIPIQTTIEGKSVTVSFKPTKDHAWRKRSTVMETLTEEEKQQIEMKARKHQKRGVEEIIGTGTGAEKETGTMKRPKLTSVN